MRKFAFTPHRTIVFIVEFSTGFLFWFRSGYFPFDIMRIVTIETILAVPGKIMDARIHIFRLMLFATLLGITLLNSKILFGAQFADVHKL